MRVGADGEGLAGHSGGGQDVSVEISATLPTTVNAGEFVPQFDIAAVANAGTTATQGLRLIGADTIQGSAKATSLVTFPGELTVRIGLNIKQRSPHKLTFVAGYTNGYIYYTPTAEQLLNVGGAQEDSDCILAPEWQALFESKVAELLKKL